MCMHTLVVGRVDTSNIFVLDLFFPWVPCYITGPCILTVSSAVLHLSSVCTTFTFKCGPMYIHVRMYVCVCVCCGRKWTCRVVFSLFQVVSSPCCIWNASLDTHNTHIYVRIVESIIYRHTYTYICTYTHTRAHTHTHTHTTVNPPYSYVWTC